MAQEITPLTKDLFNRFMYLFIRTLAEELQQTDLGSILVEEAAEVIQDIDAHKFGAKRRNILIKEVTRELEEGVYNDNQEALESTLTALREVIENYVVEPAERSAFFSAMEKWITARIQSIQEGV